jgi:hypothetical protein
MPWDSGFLRTARIRGPDLESAVPAEFRKTSSPRASPCFGTFEWKSGQFIQEGVDDGQSE